MIGTQVSHYKILKKLGEGGQGEVYQAEDTRLRRIVAIKFLPAELVADEKSRKRFLREAQLASALDHPNICTVYEINEFNGLHYIVMQYLEGKRLKQLVRSRALDLDFAISVAIQLADALAAAHNRGVIHRDVKATNVIINDRGQAKILDFGLAKATADIGDKAVQELTQRGVPFGTAGYMSPEQARGGNIDHRTDVFSLGVVLYEMVTGKLPFTGKSSVEIMHAVLHDPPTPVNEIDPSLPARLQQILEKALAKDPSHRYQTMRDFFEELRYFYRDIQSKDGKYYDHNEFVLPRQKKSSWFKDSMMGWLYKRLKPRESAPPSKSPPVEPLPPNPGPITDNLVQRSTMADPLHDSSASAWKSADKRRTVAILPFKNLSGDPETDFYSFSLADSVITELASLKSLVVRPSSYIAKYHGQKVDPQAVGRELAVDAVLVSTYLKAGTRFRVTPQLIDISTGEILWGDKIDVDYEDIITIQDKISHHIVRGLCINISDTEKGQMGKLATSNAEAYELYLRARSTYYKFVSQTLKKEDIDLAISLFQKAIGLDDKFALAHSGLGTCYVRYVLKGIGGASYYELAEDEFNNALQLDTTLVEAQLGMVYISLLKGHKARAREQIKRLLKNAGNDSSVHSTAATIFRLDGLYKQALHEYGQMLKMNPNDIVVVSYNRARLFLYQQLYDRAIDELEAGLAIEPSHCLAKIFLGQVYHYKGEYKKAIELISEALENNPEVYGAIPILSASYCAIGDFEHALSIITPQVIDTASADHDISYWLASVYAMQGDRDKAMKWFKKAVELGNENYPWFLVDFNWDRLRNDPEYVAILKKLRQQWEQLSAE
ncbi:MAG: protein kinase [Blastocatellia bacterium]|nr:protein kinase [Blastocatellia bacterium]